MTHLLLMLLVACPGKGVESVTPESGGGPDSDLDGYGENEDCDDADPAVNPGASEVCDGVDNNCDGQVDGFDAVDAQTRYTDADGDGFGDDTTATPTCGDEGVAIGGDCDDSRVEAAPDQPELCETGADEDCDGLVDEDTWWYPDEDGDGYGVAEGASCSAEAPANTSDASDDCDDDDPTIHPSATEICDDGIDQDCDGCTTECPIEFETRSWTDATSTLVGEAEGTGFSLSGVGDINGDGALDACIGSPFDSEVGIDSGKIYLVFGAIRGELPLAEMEVQISGHEHSYARACSGMTDTNDDGANEVVVGAYNDGGASQGEAYVFLSPLVAGLTADDADSAVVADDGGHLLGFSVGSSPSLLGTGFPAFAITAPGVETGGAVYLFAGPPAGRVPAVSADLTLLGPEGYTAGMDMQTGTDLNGDGYDDILVGSPNAQVTAAPGYAFIVHGPIETSQDLVDADQIATGPFAKDYFGMGVMILDDVSGDGLPDWAVMAMMDQDDGPNFGAVYLYSDRDTALLASTDATATFLGTSDVPMVADVASADLDGDGNADLVLGAALADNGGLVDAGRVLIYSGPIEGTYGPACASTWLDGETADEYAGIALANLGDLTGDGLDDLGIGVPGAHLTDDTTGGVYLFAGGSW